MELIDEHGQPVNRLYNKKRINDRAIDELIGLSRGVIADKIVSQEEAEFLQSWMQENISYCQDPIINQLYRRVKEMLLDGKLDKDEQQELLQILAEFTGESTVDHPSVIAASLPLCKPHPKVHFGEEVFCFTGKFAYGPRKLCHELTEELGGRTSKGVTLSTSYLVVGTFCSRDWAHTSYGRKIEKAAQQRQRNGYPRIISEDHWGNAAARILDTWENE